MTCLMMLRPIRTRRFTTTLIVFLKGRLLVKYTEMFDLNWRTYRSAQILWAVAAPIHIKHGYIKHHQWVIHQRYNRRGHELPSGYGPLVTRLEGFLETNVPNFIANHNTK